MTTNSRAWQMLSYLRRVISCTTMLCLTSAPSFVGTTGLGVSDVPSRKLCDSAGAWQGPTKERGSDATLLKDSRTMAGVTLAKLAELSGVSKGTIVSIEAGRTRPKLKTLEKLALVLGVLHRHHRRAATAEAHR